jgi:hypothetical protein
MKIQKIALLSVVFFGIVLHGADIMYSRQEEKPMFKAMRHRVLPQPLFYAEYQSYRLVENYLHYWIDRPLFHDSELREGKSYRNSFLRNVGIIGKYEIDGFVALSNAASLIGMYDEHLQALNEVKPYSGFSYMCGAGYIPRPNQQWHELYQKNYEMAIASPYTLRIDGKIPIWAYHSAATDVETLRELAKSLQEKTSVTPLLFAEPNDLSFRQLYEKNGALTAEQMGQLRQLLATTMDCCGGLMVTPTEESRNSSDYTAVPNSAYYRDCIVPLVLELTELPQYRDKLIGAYIRKGYVNHFSGNNTGEYGTMAFRLAMDSLMLLNPDVIVFFEWNEANENTHFQPTVSDSCTMQRLIRFYARKMRGQATLPCDGDDSSIPNLVFCSRQVLRLGDMLRYELLNIPDSDSDSEYRVQLTVRDYDGNTLKTFPEETFRVCDMKAVNYAIPTEQLAEHTLLLPELRVVNTAGKEQVFTMQYNRIHPSICWNYKEIMQPLRDMLPLTTTFAVKEGGAPGTYRIDASAESPSEELMQLEVLDNESEVCAADRENKYDPEKNIIIEGSFTAFSPSTQKVVFEVRNAPGWQWFRECHRYRSEAPDPPIVDNQVTVPSYYINYYYRYPFFITIPKGAAADAVLDIDISDLGKHSFSMGKLLELGKMAKTLDGTNRLDLAVAKNLVDIPVPLRQKQANISAVLETESRFPIYQLRAIGSSGKIYRSRPIMPMRPTGKPIRHNVYSAASQQAVTVEVASDRIPEMAYLFDAARGAMLKNNWEPFFDGQLGGGFIYLEPFNRPRPVLLDIPGRESLAPAWQTLDGNTVLAFDGKANYVNLPREALPYGSFTLEFEIKPEGNDEQVLFRNYSYHRGSLNLYRRQGKLEAAFTYRLNGINNPNDIAKFPTELELPDGKWSKVRISYNLKTLKCSVNEVSREYPFTERGVFFKPSVFGGHALPAYEAGKNARFFKGLLRNLRIWHSAAIE